jgi:hypothetical protein
MKTYVIQISNGNPKIVSEHSDINSAKVKFHSTCQNLWNSKDVITGEVAIFDEQLDVVENYKEFITHEATPEVEE